MANQYPASNLSHEARVKGGKASQAKGGHKLTTEDRSKGGKKAQSKLSRETKAKGGRYSRGGSSTWE